MNSAGLQAVPNAASEKLTIARAVRDAYLATLQQLRSDLRAAAREGGFSYVEGGTNRAPASVILDWITARDPSRGGGSQGETAGVKPGGRP